MTILAFTPLLDPITALAPDLDRYWLVLVIPLVVAISVVYKGTRVSELAHLPRAAGKMILQVLIVMTAAALAIQALAFVMTRWL